LQSAIQPAPIISRGVITLHDVAYTSSSDIAREFTPGDCTKWMGISQFLSN